MAINIGVFGFGRTGSLVAQEIIRDEQSRLCWVMRKSHCREKEYSSHVLGFDHKEGPIYSVDNIDPGRFFRENPADVIIDFSVAGAVECYETAAGFETRIVSAISRYDAVHLEQLKQLGKTTAVLYSPNITVGINFLIEASKVLRSIAPEADVEIIEEHFRGKTDVSGTALRIAEDLGLDKKEHVNSIRVGGIIGKHEVVFGLPNQTIRIVHESLNRSAFGHGALYAAKWIMDKGPGNYTMEEAVVSGFQPGF